MLTYDDCLGLCELTSEEIAAIAKHEHVPEIVALEMGSALCMTSDGKLTILHMILDDIKGACDRGDAKTAVKLQLVLYHFVVTHLGRDSLAELSRHVRRADHAISMPPAEPSLDELELATRALGVDTTAAPWVRARVDTYLTAMLRHFGLDRASVQDRFPSEMLAAEMCCAACVETARCRRFLAGVGGSDAPAAFCPNAQRLSELAVRSASGAAGRGHGPKPARGPA